MKIFTLTSILFSLLILGSCHKGMEPMAGAGEGRVYAEFSSETVPDGITGYQFENGRLTHVYNTFHRTTEGYSVEMESLSGTLYIVAWEGDSRPYDEPSAGISEMDWQAVQVCSENGQADIFYTGRTDLGPSGQNTFSVVLRRGVARFELRTEVVGEYEVRRAVIKNAYKCGYLLSQPDISSPEGAVAGEVPLMPAAYIYEQANADLKVAVDAVIDGKEYSVEADLPDIVVRNTSYTVTLRKDRLEQEAVLEVIEWGEGEIVDVSPDRAGSLSIDAELSTIPEGAVLEEDGRVLVLPHIPADFTITVSGGEKLELVSAEGYLLDVQEIPVAGTDGMNRYRIRKALYAPGVPETDAVLQFRRTGLAHTYPDDIIVLKLSSNPTVMTGPMDFDSEDYTYDFGTYVDNELAVFSLKEGYGISLEFEEGEDRWMTLDMTEENTWRLLGGWRPNDPTANGRKQMATVVISDGQNREEYTVVRRNYGLPVTWLHGIWWCKYNAMGNSRSFDDQVLSSDDPAVNAGKTLAEYLGSCDAEEYRRLWQWAYQGSSGQGMQVVEQNGVLVMDGFSTSVADHINKLPSDALSPDGYELPSMEDFNRIFDATDYVWIMWDGTHRLKTPWEGHDIVRRVQKRRNDIAVGSVTASNIMYIAMSSPDFPEHEPVVWYGPGAQWNADGILHSGNYNNILFGVYSPSGQGWYMAGALNAFYLSKNGAGTKDTRVLRFRKSDVEYVY